MKKKIIKNISLIMIGALLVATPVMAATYINSKDIEYTTEHNENITNVNEALDDLISTVNDMQTSGTATAEDILSGKTAYVNGKLLTGTRTAQNNTYGLKYQQLAQEPGGTNCTKSYNFTPSKAGKLIVVMNASRNIEGLNTAWKKSVSVGGTNIEAIKNFSNIWTGHAFWEVNVEANQSVNISNQVNTATNATSVCGLTVLYVE